MDDLWAGAWWFLGTTFFRQSVLPWNGRMEPLLHLRIRMNRFALSASQRRVLQRNRSLRLQVRPAEITDVQRDLFHRHKRRFVDGVPDSLDDFLGPAPASHPVSILEFSVHDGRRLLAASYLARGENSVASLYGIFDPGESARSLGTLTMLLELAYTQQRGFEFYYPGYALLNPSPMDYKKRFHGLESYEGDENWREFPRQLAPPPTPETAAKAGPLHVGRMG
jgi:leucyl-tRNA---protein transferase